MSSKKTFSADLCILIVFSLACIYMFCASIPLSFETRLFPQIISAATFVFCMYLIGKTFFGKADDKNAEKAKDAKNENEPKPIRHLFFVGASALYVLLLTPLGFLLDTICMCIGIPVILGNKNFKVIIPVAIVTAVVLYLIFNKLFFVNLPKGLLTFL